MEASGSRNLARVVPIPCALSWVVFGRLVVGQHAGSREKEPHGREWLKYVTGLGEAETVKVVRNGEGGPKREWKPATRCRC